jgi:hypothetical protein
MKTLKNIFVTIIPASIKAGFEEENEFKSMDVTVDITDVECIVSDRLQPDEELKELLIQVTEDQHLSEERILYRMVDESYRFLAVSNMTVREQGKYNAFKIAVETEINS